MPYPGGIPQSFEPTFYRAGNPGLALEGDAEAEAHYLAEGREAGLIASPIATREGLIEFLDAAELILEVGPFCRPLLTGPRVDYLDVLDADALRERGRRLGLDVSNCPQRIDFVGGLDQVDRQYDVVVSSHAIEHQPDLIAHLSEVERILRPGGMFALIIPDKRYCFDHFLPESSIASVLQAHEERRTVHSLASVVEHGALLTHNDAARHWAGDHGDPEIDRAKRIRSAIERFERSEGDYLDVHAWQFTPHSFRALVETLADLGLTRLEPIVVCDTPRDRMEFTALLQLRRPARRPARQDHGMTITFLQTADPFRYYEMLKATAPTVIEYCRRHGLAYESYVGIRRGCWNWQATYNRIPMLADLLTRGFTGWAVYLDADAYINDLDFDLPTYLANHQDRPAVFANSGVTGERWDVNAGVAMINFGHAEGRRLVARWAAAFDDISDADLAASPQWRHGDNDQDLLQAILREDDALRNGIVFESMDFINSRHASFIRQHLRAQTAELSERISGIAAEVRAIFAQDGLREGPSAPETILDERARYSLYHPVRSEVRLVAAPVATPRLDLVARAIAIFAAAPASSKPHPFQHCFAEALARGDTVTVGADLAALGQAEFAQGLLGGARQHARATQDPVFAYRRAQRTRDALLSLAEIVGALHLENPDHGMWGRNSLVPSAELAAMIAATLGIAIDPPAHIGGYLGIAAGGARVLHLRMIEAIHTAWRASQLSSGGTVVEIVGGIGLTAFYGQQLGISAHVLVDVPLLHAIQAYVLGDLPAKTMRLAITAEGVDADLAILEDGFFELPLDAAQALLRQVRAAGVRKLLGISQEGRHDEAPPVPPLRERIAELGGYTLIGRQRHALRPGYLEEVYALR